MINDGFMQAQATLYTEGRWSIMHGRLEHPLDDAKRCAACWKYTIWSHLTRPARIIKNYFQDLTAHGGPYQPDKLTLKIFSCRLMHHRKGEWFCYIAGSYEQQTPGYACSHCGDFEE